MLWCRRKDELLQLAFTIFVFFFFSSRRRHTRYIGDWSSDVCSSDLVDAGFALQLHPFREKRAVAAFAQLAGAHAERAVLVLVPVAQRGEEIGRASCRERV